MAAPRERAEKKLPPEDEKRLDVGVSNGGYHYLGAARIMAPIGKAFAEANLRLLEKDQREPDFPNHPISQNL